MAETIQRTVLVVPVYAYTSIGTIVGTEVWLKSLQDLVHGLIEPVDLPEFGCTLWVNEEGELHQLPTNWKANHMVMAGGGLTFGPLKGDAVVTGGTGPDGETLGLDPTQLAQLLAAVMVEEET